jgi:hypothetical protein
MWPASPAHNGPAPVGIRLTGKGRATQCLTQGEYDSLGMDYPVRSSLLMKAVPRKDMLCVVRAYLHPERRSLVVVAPLPEADSDAPSRKEEEHG